MLPFHLRNFVTAACGLSILGVAAPVAAAGAAPAASSVPVSITFSVTADSPSPVDLQLNTTNSGARIDTQGGHATSGALAGFYTLQNGAVTRWGIDPAYEGKTVNVTVTVSGDATPGQAISGNVATGFEETVTASVNKGPAQTLNGNFSLPIPASGTLGSSPGSTGGPTLSVSPRAAKPGRRITVSGTAAGGCARGDAVTLLSKAFNGTYRFAGLPAVYANVAAKSRFAVMTRIPANRKPGKYTITGRCGGGSLGAVAYLRVTK